MTIEEKRKIGIFPKGLTNDFGKKFEISPEFRFSYKGLDTLVDYILHRQHGFPDYKNDIRRKTKN